MWWFLRRLRPPSGVPPITSHSWPGPCISLLCCVVSYIIIGYFLGIVQKRQDIQDLQWRFYDFPHVGVGTKAKDEANDDHEGPQRANLVQTHNTQSIPEGVLQAATQSLYRGISREKGNIGSSKGIIIPYSPY